MLTLLDDPAKQAEDLIQKYNIFVNRIAELGLHTAVDLRPILDVSCILLLSNPLLDSKFYQGRQVIQVMGASKPGPWTGKVLARVIEWQLEHPNGTKDECEKWLQAEHEAGRIHVEENAASGSADKRLKFTEGGSAMKKAKR